MRALVTGASSGIGLRYAETLARDYYADLLLVSNQEQALQEAAARISATYGVQADALCMDLAQLESARKLYQYACDHKMEIEVLVNDAGFFFFDEFVRVPLEKIESMMLLHMVTLTELTRLFGADMCRRGHGYVLNMSSMCAWMPYPGIQVYNSTKAYVYNFTRSIRTEFRLHGVKVTVVTPGAVDTPLYGLSPKYRRLVVRLHVCVTPEKLASRALKALFAGRKRCMPGLINYLIKPFCYLLPDPLEYAIFKRIVKDK